jgi:hypothetical protein
LVQPLEKLMPRAPTPASSAEADPEVAGVLHAYAFWIALVAAASLVTLSSTHTARGAAAGHAAAGLCTLFAAEIPLA